MRKLLAAIFGSVLATAAALVTIAPPAGAAPVTVTFDHTGALQPWVVPAGVHDVAVELLGAGGGDGFDTNAGTSLVLEGAPGGRTVSFLAVSPGEVLRILVGGRGSNGAAGSAGGFNGGGNGAAVSTDEGDAGSGGGGGATDIRQGGVSLAHRVAVAGGGGGAPSTINHVGVGPAFGTGAGGGIAGEKGVGSFFQCFGCDFSGRGGTQTAGGAGGVSLSADGTVGTAGRGGDGGANDTPFNNAGGGGGGGLFGGGGGAADDNPNPDHKDNGGGGGGSGYEETGFGSTTTGDNHGHGLVTITYDQPAAVPGAPTGVSAAPGNGQATVSFSPPVDSGSSPITGYLAICGSPDGGPSNTGTSSPIVVSGLTNEVTVTCIVQAINDAGQSAYSAPSNPVTPTAPPAGDQQPDGRIRQGTTFLGNDIYNADASGQTVTKSAKRNATASFEVRVQNDGTTPSSFRLRGGGSGTKFGVAYKAGTTNITSAVVAGTYTTPVLNPGALFTVKIEVTPTSAAAIGQIRDVNLKATDGPLSDTVRARTQVVS